MTIAEPVTIFVEKAAQDGRPGYRASVTDRTGRVVYASPQAAFAADASGMATRWVAEKALRLANLYWERPANLEGPWMPLASQGIDRYL
jgi:hypothetical protein